MPVAPAGVCDGGAQGGTRDRAKRPSVKSLRLACASSSRPATATGLDGRRGRWCRRPARSATARCARAWSGRASAGEKHHAAVDGGAHRARGGQRLEPADDVGAVARADPRRPRSRGRTACRRSARPARRRMARTCTGGGPAECSRASALRAEWRVEVDAGDLAGGSTRWAIRPWFRGKFRVRCQGAPRCEIAAPRAMIQTKGCAHPGPGSQPGEVRPHGTTDSDLTTYRGAAACTASAA